MAYQDYYVELDPKSGYVGFFFKMNGGVGQGFEIRGREHVKPLSLQAAQIVVQRISEYKIRSRIIDSEGRPVSSFDGTDLNARATALTLHNAHSTTTYHSRGIEVELIHNAAIDRWFHKFRFPVADGPERSISGSSPEEIIDKLLGDPGVKAYVDTLHVDETVSAPAPAASAGPAVQVTIPPGYVLESVSVRPGSAR